MAQCPHCQTEYNPEPGQGFCGDCGKPLDQGLAVAEPASDDGEPETPAPVSGAGPASSGPGNVKVQGVGEGNVAGRDVIIQQQMRLMYCAFGGEQVYEDRNFRCPNCGLTPLCAQHYDQDLRKCAKCTEGRKVLCSLCHDRLPASQTFTCQKCRRIVGDDHRDPDQQQRCSECSAEWAGVVEAIERDEVGVSMDGTVVGRDDVELKDGVLRTKDGKPVATIKENTWYARPKQWYRVKARLLEQEQQVMRRFYPSFQMGSAPDGDCFWQGIVTTWAGNEYEVHLRYPDSFPYRPPKVYVMKPKIEQSRHIYPDGHLCLFHKDDRSWGPKTTAATVMSWVSLWLHCYEVWLETGHWPRPEHDDLVITTSY
ncbi:MAG TPA: hypothetical protein QGI03_14440 [Dehalococcoidia bacterium]|nr:hypothetical protein [Dehalococcoidia bacterium]